jgi:hypothetical protein
MRATGCSSMTPSAWFGRGAINPYDSRRFVPIPIALAISKRNQVDAHGDLWMSVLEATGQPPR